jgi:hypothetical protein
MAAATQTTRASGDSQDRALARVVRDIERALGNPLTACLAVKWLCGLEHEWKSSGWTYRQKMGQFAQSWPTTLPSLPIVKARSRR